MYALNRFTVLVVCVASALATPFLVTLNGTQIGHLHDYGMERTSERRREGIFGASDGEAASAGVTCT